MSDVRSRIIAAFVTLILALATLLMCRTAALPGVPDRLPPVPDFLGSYLTLPVDMLSPSDVRPYVIFLGLAGLLVLLAAPKPSLTTTNVQRGLSTQTGFMFELAAGLTLLVAWRSAVWNDSLLLSRGWILSYACGAGWAILLARHADGLTVRSILTGAAIVVIVGGACTLWHRRRIGPQFVEYPVGPVTMLGGLGAVWSAFALACWIGQRRERQRQVWRQRIDGARQSPARHGLLASVTLVLSIALLVVSERQTGYLALLAAAAYMAIMLTLTRLPSRQIRAWFLVAILIAAAIAAWALFAFWYLPGQTAASKFSARWIFWSRMLESLDSWWPRGVGPDMFVCRMTTALAPWRAEHPRVLPGNVDLDAHNEWLQAFYEMGVVGGLCYLALPLIVLAAVTRHYLKRRGRGAGLVCLPCGAAIVAVLVGETANINLRYPTFQVWYWTLLGISLAVSEPGLRRGAATSFSWRLPASIAAAACLLWVTMDDFHRAMAHAEGRAWLGRDDEDAHAHLAFARDRWGAANWLAVSRDLGDAQLNLALREADPANATKLPSSSAPSSGTAAWGLQATQTLGELVRRCSGYPGARFKLAKALVLAGRQRAAMDSLADELKASNDPRAIELFLATCSVDCDRILALIATALRCGQWTESLEHRLEACFSQAGVSDRWLASLSSLQPAAGCESWAGTSAPEDLRIEAIRLTVAGDLLGAAAAQLRAADAYRRLARECPEWRRAVAAEVDVWYKAAELVLSADRSQFQRAFDLIGAAERMALAESVVSLEQGAGDQTASIDLRKLVPGQSDRFQKMWYLSAMLHLANDQPLDQTRIRAMLSLPADRRSVKDLDAQMAHLAGQVVRMYADIPAPRRPACYERLKPLAATASPAPSD